MDVLITLGTYSAYLYGMVLIIAGYPELLSMKERMERVMEHAHFFDTSAVLITIILLGKFLENYSKSKTIKKLTELSSLRITQAVLFIPKE